MNTLSKQPVSFHYVIPAGAFDSIAIDVTDILGFWVFDVRVDITQNLSLDIGLHISDHDNYIRWTTIQKTAGAIAQAPIAVFIASSRHRFGTLIFHPSEKGIYYLILDNTYSNSTTKSLVISSSWASLETNSRREIRETLQAIGWNNTWELFEKAESSLAANHFAESCYNMRTALATLWKQVAEKKARQAVSFDSGKSTDITSLKKLIEPYVSTQIVSVLAQNWSLCSELAHAEKHDGIEPTKEEARLSMRLALDSAAFLASIIRN